MTLPLPCGPPPDKKINRNDQCSTYYTCCMMYPHELTTSISPSFFSALPPVYVLVLRIRSFESKSRVNNLPLFERSNYNSQPYAAKASILEWHYGNGARRHRLLRSNGTRRLGLIYNERVATRIAVYRGQNFGHNVETRRESIFSYKSTKKALK